MSEEIKKKKKRKKYKKRKVKKEPKKRTYSKHTHQIVLLNNNKQVEFIGSYPSETKANIAFNKLMAESNNVIYPVQTNNTKHKTLEPSKYELAIIKKREDNDPKVTMIRNEMGDYVEQITISVSPYVVSNTILFLKSIILRILPLFFVFGLTISLKTNKNVFL